MAAAIPNGYMPTYTPKPVTTATSTGLAASKVAPSTTKTTDQYVPFISANHSPTGGNTTEYRAPRAGDTGIGVSAPTVNTPTNTAPKFDAAGIAASRVVAQRAALAGSVNAYDASTKAAFDHAQQTTQGNRALLQFDNSNRGDQFGGSAREDLFRLQRSQGLEDTAANTQYQNDISASDAKLAAFDAGAPGMTQDIQSQLEHQNLTDNIALSGVTGMYNGSPTYDASQAAIKNGQTAADSNATQTGNYISPENTALLQKQQQNSAAYATASPDQQAILHQNNLDIAKQLGETYNAGTGTYSGGNYSQRTVAGQTLDMNNAKDMATLTGYISDGKGGYIPTNAKQQQDLTDAWTATNNLGSVTKALSDLTGIPVGTPTQTAKNQAQQINISQQGATTSAKNATTAATNSANSNNNANQTHLMDIWKATGKAPAGIQGVAEGTAYAGTAKASATADDFIKSMDSTPLVSNIAGMRRVTDPVAMEKAILDSGMTPEEMTKAYRAYNIPMK